MNKQMSTGSVSTKILNRAREFLNIEAEALRELAGQLDDQLCILANLILRSSGVVAVSGVGKSGLVGEKISATLTSTGTRSITINPTDALHGDLGRLRPEDILLCLSHSGETKEVIELALAAKRLQATVATITGQAGSSLAKISDFVVSTGQMREACPLGLTPTTTTTVQMALGDTLALIILEQRGFTPKDFARFHPGGSLGKHVISAQEIMKRGENLLLVSPRTPLKHALLTMSKSPYQPSAVVVVGDDNQLLGLVTERELECILDRDNTIFDAPVELVMYRDPPTAKPETPLQAVLEVLERTKSEHIVIVDELHRVAGMIVASDGTNYTRAYGDADISEGVPARLPSGRITRLGKVIDADLKQIGAPEGPLGRSLAPNFSVVYRSPEPTTIFCYTPGIARSKNGRLIATLDVGGPGVAYVSGPKASRAGGTRFGQGKLFTSDDGGSNWLHRMDFPFWHARPFFADDVLYVLGQQGDLMIMASHDYGNTWSEPARLSRGEKWHGSACNIHYHGRHLYLALDQRKDLRIEGWNVAGLAPRVLRARVDANLLDRTEWSFSDASPFNNIVSDEAVDWWGVPFYRTPERRPAELGAGRVCAPMGWLEPNIVRFLDPSHTWHDPSGKTLHLLLRSNTGGTGYAALAKVIEDDDGRMRTFIERAPSGKNALFMPLPGGHLKYYILFDSKSSLFWLVSSQPTDSMAKLSALSSERYNLANNERHRLQLHFSKNCVDWCFAGLVTAGVGERHARNYPSMVIDGEDLVVLCRSGDDASLNAQYTNLITSHRIRDFRSLIY
ncbi:KpsF/GutQ family sugar-phosphate isomerase [Ensifer aridi]|uniref:KpsF/GutQ family sugar-phosphate isomerase n=1 Tax=Ensifer aridi TaxID=1708715 RepID=UPI000423AAC3|nr:KpsF/GutQ family sugar-phosphate isomerase [Ensifer aridi]